MTQPQHAPEPSVQAHDVAPSGQSRPVAIVSGGAGGIGSVLSERLAASGHTVVVADASEQAARAILERLASHPGEHTAVVGDLTTRACNAEAVAAAVARGPLVALVNAVGISPKEHGRKRPFFDVGEEEWDQVMEVNVKAPLLLIQEAFRHMPGDGRSSIVNLLSITSKWGTGGLPGDPFPPYLPSSVAYAASKAALQNLTASLSRELSSARIRVNGVAPGFVDTQMLGGMPGPETAQITSQIPMQRFARPSEIADAIGFLISPASSYITGASLDVNGGALTC